MVPQLVHGYYSAHHSEVYPAQCSCPFHGIKQEFDLPSLCPLSEWSMLAPLGWSFSYLHLVLTGVVSNEVLSVFADAEIKCSIVKEDEHWKCSIRNVESKYDLWVTIQISQSRNHLEITIWKTSGLMHSKECEVSLSSLLSPFFFI